MAIRRYFQTDAEWEQEFQAIKELLPKLTEFKGKLGDSANNLLEALQYEDEISMRLGKLYTYAHMRYDQDTTNSVYQALNDRATNLYSQVSSSTAYIVPEILSISEDTLQTFLKENRDLSVYEHALEEITRQRPHVLSEAEEALLAEASEVMSASSNTFGMLNNADLKFPSIKGEDGRSRNYTWPLHSVLESDDRRVREDAFKAVYETYGKYKNTFASTLSGAVKRNNFNARVRKYDSARQAALSNNNIPEAVYDQLVQSVNDNLHLLHRYIDIRKRALGLDELHMYDLYTPLVPEVKMNVKYEEAQDMLLKSLHVLGDEYVDILKKHMKIAG